MSSDPPRETAAARTRRRWITLGEVLAVASVAIGGLSLWVNREDHSAEVAERTGAQRRADAAARTLLLKATSDRAAHRLDLTPTRADQSIQSQTVRFPTALGIAPVETTGDARIEADWFRAALVKARHAADMESTTRGDARLPVLLTTRFMTDGQPATDRTIYDIGYATSTGFLSGTDVALHGLSLVMRNGGVRQLDALWAPRLRAMPTVRK